MEFDHTFCDGKDTIVTCSFNAFAWMNTGAALTYNNFTTLYYLAIKEFNP
jgi:hypothetical protein